MVCPTAPHNRRRIFWATIPDACGSEPECNTHLCGYPGLVIDNGQIVTDDYLRSLIINMLMTDGREPDTACGSFPGSLGGHWSESFIEDSDEPTIGTLVRTIPPQGSTQDMQNLVQAYAEATLARLVVRRVATRIAVNVEYVANGRYSVTAEVYGQNSSRSRVALSTERLRNGWVWSTQQ